jgi:radical SAM superfamily enzyme YgiQ (UPF0313 family)
MGYYNRDFPLGLAYLASTLRAKGHEAIIFDDVAIKAKKYSSRDYESDLSVYLKSLNDDNHVAWKELKLKIREFAADIVGITVITPSIASAFKVASIVKKTNKDIAVVMGGPHITLKFDEVMKICPDVDFLVRGEGEIAFSELVAALKHNLKGGRFKDIDGLSYRHNGEILHNPKVGFIENLDSIPFPARDLLIFEDSYDPENMGALMASRGCPYDCAYCATSIWGRVFRCRSVDNIINEIDLIINRYGTTHFSFKDDAFTVKKDNVIEFCNRLKKEKIKITWDCNTRVDLLNENLLIEMKTSGCTKIKIGIESGSERILRVINKKITLDQFREAAKLFRKLGIYWTGYFMIGIPTETKEDMYKTLKFIKEVKPDFASLSVYEPFPGTSLFELGLKMDLVQRERKIEEFYSISPINYYIKDSNRRIDTMDNEEFENIRYEITEAVHKYNRGIRRLAKKAKSRFKIYLNEPNMLWTDSRKFYSWIR